MASLQSAKAALRLKMKKKIELIDLNNKLRQSQIVTEKVFNSWYFKKSKRVSIYISRSDEVQTFDLIKKLHNLGKDCYIPRYSTENNQMDMVKLHSTEEINNFSKTKWNIIQPHEKDERENALNTGGLDLIFVPGIAFTKTGLRLGRGKGYYDKFLQNCLSGQSDPPTTVGLAFLEQIVNDIPTDQHDFKLDVVVCPN